MKTSACTFIRNNTAGFCLWESMASWLPLVDEFVVLDLGSDDGTLELLEEAAGRNRKLRVLRGRFPTVDAGAFATLANDLIGGCRYDRVVYYQSDEVPHEHLLGMVRERLDAGADDLSFWRYQLGYNFQSEKWLPHVVHRVGVKGRFRFVGDGMNSDRFMEPPICSDYGGAYFLQWGQMHDRGEFRGRGYERQMILDVSLLGGFRDAIPARRRLHAPFWHEEPVIPYRREGERHDRQLQESDWVNEAARDPRWTRTESPFDLPRIMRWHVSRPRYDLRRDLFEAICRDDTAGMVGL